MTKSGMSVAFMVMSKKGKLKAAVIEFVWFCETVLVDGHVAVAETPLQPCKSKEVNASTQLKTKKASGGVHA